MDALEPGNYIDYFKIIKVLHAGAMGQIYKATDMLSDQTVSIKMPFGDILNHPILYYHFQNEERIGRLLNHDRIVAFLDKKHSAQYLVLEYIPGKDLRSAVPRDRKISLEKALEIICQIAEGLTYLHDRGVIHLDIKPENIMVTPDIRIKVIDFGLARILDAADLLTEDFMEPQGTPFYIAPEQLLGCRDNLRSDIYSLGMVFYELLTGKLPFERSTHLSKVKIRLKADPVPPRHYDPDIAPQIQEIILKSLEKDPANRYQSAAALIEDLTHYDKIKLSQRSWNHHKRSFWHSRFNKPIHRYDKGESEKDRELPPQILGAIIDHDSSDQAVEMIKHQAILRNCGITLLTVIDEDPDSDITSYQTTVEGERFRLRIDGYVERLRNYNLDPLVRIKRGAAAEEIIQLAKTINADLIILGTPRKKGLKKLFGGSTIDKVIKKAPCNVVVAESPIVAAPLLVDISDITSGQIFNIDLFLLDSWVYHLNWLSDLTYSLLQDPKQIIDLNEHHCMLGKWIDQLAEKDRWISVLASITEPHKKFHDVSRHMAESARSGNIKKMKRIYFEQALPLSIRIREGLQTASTTLRKQLAYQEAGLLPFFDPDAGTSDKKVLPSGRTREKIKRIRDYFWRYPDGSPETCLLTLEMENRPENRIDAALKKE
ncbi:MAG: protein kinase [Thermodesulfobacteriota bacterium]|nr:protein kinase [Thermodesulfobacteriota bacterium]